MLRSDKIIQEMKIMLLSAETHEGIYITGSSTSFHSASVNTVKSFCWISVVFIREIFGCQRQRGRSNGNLSVHDFCKNTQALWVINTICSRFSKGNCRGNVEQPNFLSSVLKVTEVWVLKAKGVNKLVYTITSDQIKLIRR